MPSVQLLSAAGEILLREPTLDDSENLWTRGQDPTVVVHLPHLVANIGKKTLEEDRKWLSKVIEGNAKGECLFLVIVRTSDNRVIGDSGLGSIDMEKKLGETGVMLDNSPDVRGKGYAVEVLRMTFQHAFEKVGLEKVEVNTLEANKPMSGIMEKKFGLEGERSESKAGMQLKYMMTKSHWETMHAGAST